MRGDILVGAVFECEEAHLRYAFLRAFRAPRFDRINTGADGLTCGLRGLPRLGKGNGVEGTQAELAHPTIACGELKEPTSSSTPFVISMAYLTRTAPPHKLTHVPKAA